MNRLSKDTKMVGAIVALVLFAGYYFLIKPQGGELSKLQAGRAAVEQSVTEVRLLLDRSKAPAGTGQAAAVTPAAAPDALDAAVPPDGEIPGLLRQLQAIAAATAMQQSSISPGPVGANPAGVGGSIQIAIVASGSPDAARSYLQQLQMLPRLILVEQIGVHTASDGSGAQVQLAIRVFTRTAPSVVKS